jgi:hypothetical protein
MSIVEYIGSIVSINGKKNSCPTCWETVATRKYQRMVKEWNWQEPDEAKRDYGHLHSILTDTDYVFKDLTPEMEVTIGNRLQWFIDTPFPRYNKLPKLFVIGDRAVEIPKNVGDLSIGQNIMMRQVIDKSNYLEENIARAIAIYLQPKLDKSRFNVDRVNELEKEILEMPIHRTFALGFFLLKRANGIGSKLMRILSRILNNRWRSSKRT